jgi:hypothetical protein
MVELAIGGASVLGWGQSQRDALPGIQPLKKIDHGSDNALTTTVMSSLLGQPNFESYCSEGQNRKKEVDLLLRQPSSAVRG